MDQYFNYANEYLNAHWAIYPETIQNAKFNVFFSFIGYILFCLIIYGSFKKGVIWRHIHDVFLILGFAFITDMIETRMHLFFIFNFQDRADLIYVSDGSKLIPTSIEACTVANMLFFAHFLITYVEGIVSIYRFILRFCEKAIRAHFVYVCLGIVFAIKAALLIATFYYGTILESTSYCTRFYFLYAPMNISAVVWAASSLIAPVLSTLTLIKGIVRKHHDSSVSAFILASSLCMTALIFSYILSISIGSADAIPFLCTAVFKLASIINEFRFCILCLLAIAFIRDIRDAVASTLTSFAPILSGAIKHNFGHPESTKPIVNENFLESVEVNGKGKSARLNEFSLI